MLWVTAGALWCYATQVLAGLLLWRALARGDGNMCTRWGAALLVGPAAVTVQMVAYHALRIPFGVTWLAAPWWLLAVFIWRRRDTVQLPAPARPGPAVLASIVLLTSAIAARAFAVPIHDGDEVNNFTLFAKVFGTLGSLAPDRLHALVEPGHVEYPHLVALNQAWLFALEPDSAPFTARGFDVLGALALFLLCAGASAAGGAAAAALCMIGIATPALSRFAVGFADVRLLATFVLIGQQAASLFGKPDRHAPLRLALALGTAALTKNEGFAIAAVGCLVLAYGVVRQRAGWHGAGAVLVAGALLLLWPLVRHGIGLAMPYVSRAFELPLAELTAQTPRVLRAWLAMMFPLDLKGLLDFGVFWWVVLSLALWRALHERRARWLLLAFALHLALYTYMLGAARLGDLEALLGTAGTRLLLHTMAWPLLVVLWPLTVVQEFDQTAREQ
jgi:hypothetical protein